MATQKIELVAIKIMLILGACLQAQAADTIALQGKAASEHRQSAALPVGSSMIVVKNGTNSASLRVSLL